MKIIGKNVEILEKYVIDFVFEKYVVLEFEFFCELKYSMFEYI